MRFGSTARRKSAVHNFPGVGGEMDTEHGDFLRATCLEVVVFTIVVLGGLMSLFAHVVGIRAPSETPAGINEEERSQSVSITDLDVVSRTTRLHLWWRRFDENIMKPLFGGKLRRQETLDERLLHEDVPVMRGRRLSGAEEEIAVPPKKRH